MKKLLCLFAIPLAVLLTACGPKNPLLGQWESEPVMGISNSIEFKRSSMIGSSAMGGASSSSEISVKEYKVQGNTVAVVLEQNGSTATFTYNVIDPNTIEQDMGFVKQRFHRKS